MSGSTGSSAEGRAAAVDRQIAERLFLLTFCVYAYFYAGAGWNQNSQFDLTRAIVERHSFAIDPYVGNTGDVARHGAHIYSNKSPGLSWLAAVPYALLHAVESDSSNAVLLIVNNYLCTVTTVATFGALIPALLFLFARRMKFDAPWAATIALVIAFATPLLPYSTLLMLHVPSGALMLLAITTEKRWLSGVAAGLATAMNYLCAPLVVLVFLLPARDRRERVQRALGAAVPLALLAAYNKLCFGAFATLSIAHEDERFLQHDKLFGIFNPPSAEAFFGITISAYRGIFFLAPVLLLGIAGAVLWLRSRERRAELVIVTVMSLVFFGFNVTFNGWDGGFGIGARYLVPLVPLWGVAMLWCRGLLRPLLLVLAAVSFAFNFAATAVDPEPSGTIPSPLTQYIFPLLVHGRFSPDVPITAPWSAATFTGHTSVNRLAHDEAIVFSRHPPGSPPSEWSSFNLGEPFFGAGDARSLIPVLLLLAGGTAAILRAARRARGAQ